MGTHKTTKRAFSTTRSIPTTDPTTKRHAKGRKQASSKDVPGVQKVKAALRQTKRLLAKEDLAADVRNATERRLKSLEGDLAEAELARTERSMALRYHKVKFFERQKVLRKISRTKRMLESGIDAQGQNFSKKQRKALAAELFERRVDLNYILHYPKSSKYISLFPPNASAEDKGEGSEILGASHGDSRDNEGEMVTARKRQELRDSVRSAMNLGKISIQPEVERTISEMSVPPQSDNHARLGGPQSKKTMKSKLPGTLDLNNDSFFEIDVD